MEAWCIARIEVSGWAVEWRVVGGRRATVRPVISAGEGRGTERAVAGV